MNAMQQCNIRVEAETLTMRIETPELAVVLP